MWFSTLLPIYLLWVRASSGIYNLVLYLFRDTESSKPLKIVFIFALRFIFTNTGTVSCSPLCCNCFPEQNQQYSQLTALEHVYSHQVESWVCINSSFTQSPASSECFLCFLNPISYSVLVAPPIKTFKKNKKEEGKNSKTSRLLKCRWCQNTVLSMSTFYEKLNFESSVRVTTQY